MKKAICLSDEAYLPYLKHVHDHTLAVLFLGIPSHGLDLTGFAAGVANILKIGGKRVNREILMLLYQDSEGLAGIEYSFA